MCKWMRKFLIWKSDKELRHVQRQARRVVIEYCKYQTNRAGAPSDWELDSLLRRLGSPASPTRL